MALVGASRTGRKFGNLALKELRAKGYRVYPVHPFATSIDGVSCAHAFESLPEPVDAVLITVPPSEAAKAVRQAAAAGIREVWLQQGAESPAVLEACRETGVTAISGECILMFASPTSYHKVHQAIWKLLAKYPH